MGRVFLALAAIVAGAFLLQVANGWLGLLIPAQLGAANYPATAVGIAVTAHSVGFFVGCLVSPRLIRRISRGETRQPTKKPTECAVTAMPTTVAG